VPAIWKIVIAAVIFGGIGATFNRFAGGNWGVVALVVAAFGIVCFPWFQELRAGSGEPR
jgi:hypothetical protein